MHVKKYFFYFGKSTYILKLKKYFYENKKKILQKFLQKKN